VSSFKVAELVLALGNLGLWRVLCFQQCTEEFGRYSAFSSFRTSCQAVKLILASKNLAIWQVLFPAVFSSFCVLWNLAGTVLLAVSVSVFGNLI